MDGSNCERDGWLYITKIPGHRINGWKWIYHAAYAVGSSDRRVMYLTAYDSNGSNIGSASYSHSCDSYSGEIKCKWRVSPPVNNATTWQIRFYQNDGNAHWDTTYVWGSNLDYAYQFGDVF